jgi:ketosteroid isomerase-like protein
MKSPLIVALLLVSCTAVVAPDVGDVHAERFRLMTAGDLAALAPMLADDLVYVHSDGALENKEQFLERLRAGGIRYRTIDSQETNVRVDGNTATVTGTANMVVTINGADRDIRVRYTAVYRRAGGRWMLTTWQSTRLATAAP